MRFEALQKYHPSTLILFCFVLFCFSSQYYVYLGGQKYVDLGLGTHRVKCRVDDDFK